MDLPRELWGIILSKLLPKDLHKVLLDKWTFGIVNTHVFNLCQTHRIKFNELLIVEKVIETYGQFKLYVVDQDVNILNVITCFVNQYCPCEPIEKLKIREGV